MDRVQAKKSLGQHFLTDKNIAGKIVNSLKGDNCTTILEIGPGMGVLTNFLIADPRFCAVEIDQEALNYLHVTYPERTSCFISSDILKFNFKDLNSPIAIIGNLPYYISSQIFFKVLENKDQVTEVVCMIQKEVAERIASGPGTKKYGILSVLLQAFFNVEYLFTVHEHCFSPAPKVKSAVIRFTRNKVDQLACNEALFFKVVKAGFNQRRKTLRNSLKSFFVNLDGQDEIFQKRPEQLSVSQFVALTNMVELIINRKE